MIISKTPLRISFFGGGTDYPGYYEVYGGETLGTTIDKYIYLTLSRLSAFFDHRIHIGYSKSELARTVDEIQHPSVKACLKHLGIDSGVEIFVMADLPARTGLGSSSCFTVGLLTCLHAFKGNLVSKDFIAREAIHIEQKLIGERVGSQDQVATSFGGILNIHFNKQATFRAEPLPASQERVALLQDHLMLYFTGISRTAHEILEEQAGRMEHNSNALGRMRQQVKEACHILCDPKRDLREFGEMLHESWTLKKSLSSRVSNEVVDDAYAKARRKGAVGGKLCGAGGGGFILLFVPPDRQDEVRAALSHLIHVPFRFETTGSHLIYFQH